MSDEVPQDVPERRLPARQVLDGKIERRFSAMQAQIDARFLAAAADTAEVKDNLAANTAAVERVEQGMVYAIDLIEAMRKGGLFVRSMGRALGWLGRFINKTARWLTPVLAVVGIVWAILHGRWPDGAP